MIKAVKRIEAALFEAIDQRDLKRVRELLAHGASPHSTDKHGTPALNHALYGTVRLVNGDQSIAMLLLEYGAEPDASDVDGVTPIMLASRSGFSSLAKRLVEERVDVNGKAKDGDLRGSTALYLAAAQGHREIVRLLIASGADVNVPVRGRWNALAGAALKGDVRIVHDLIAAGAKAHGVALFAPVIAGQLDIVTALIDAGADVNALDGPRTGNGVLQVAVQTGNEAMVRAIIRAGAKLDRITSGRTPLIFSVCLQRAELVEVLLQAGAKVDARDIYRCTALMEAAFRGEEAILLRLLAAGANPRLKSEVGTAMQGARENGHIGIVRILEEATRRKAGERRSSPAFK